jgi:hypothetical protein
MFLFVVRNARWLARLPGLPQFFDTLLLAWTWAAHRSRLAAMERLEAEALRLPGVSLKTHRFGGTEFVRAGREMGHLHGHGLVDARVGRAEARALIMCSPVRAGSVSNSKPWRTRRLPCAC